MTPTTVPPWVPLTPAVLGSLVLVGYSLTLPVRIPRAVAEASAAEPFTLTGAFAGWSYYRRTRAGISGD
uniref:hypothetical protein n=1 Tax=Herbidospora sakaeratensis TaxID=564415 RepID=UPI000785A98C|nr:hypothetical protein [Herbidospora sakaeratensis]